MAQRQQPRPSRRRPATSEDVARRAGVSQSAVSRAFTEGASIAETTKRRIMQAAADLNYRPNLLARSLMTRRSKIIGVAVGYMENQFYPALLEHLSVALAKHGYRILLFTTSADDDADPMLETVLSSGVDALVSASMLLSSRMADEYQRAGTPVVLVNRRSDVASASCVTGNNVAGARALAEFLVASGHRRFAYVRGKATASTSLERERGFREGLASHGFEFATIAADYDFQAAKAATRNLLALADRPDAIFYANDHMAFAGIEVIRDEWGLVPGRDVSVVGFDDVPAASWSSFDLTTWSQPLGPMVGEIVRLTMDLLDDPDRPRENVVVPGALVIRSSSRRPRR